MLPLGKSAHEEFFRQKKAAFNGSRASIVSDVKRSLDKCKGVVSLDEQPRRNEVEAPAGVKSKTCFLEMSAKRRFTSEIVTMARCAEGERRRQSKTLVRNVVPGE